MLRAALCLTVALVAAPAAAQIAVDIPGPYGSYAVVRAGDSQKDCAQLRVEIDALNTRADEPQRKLDAGIEARLGRGVPGGGVGQAMGMASAAGLIPGKAAEAAAMASMMGALTAETARQDALRREITAMQPLRDRARHLWNIGQRKSCGLPILPEDDFSIVESVD